MSNDSSLRNASAMLVFAEVVQKGGFSAAARSLGLSKAWVSREVSALEQRLGAQLLRRTTRRMSLTEVGELFYARCQRVAEEAEAAEYSVTELQAEPRGEIRLAAPMSFGHIVIAPRLPGFLTLHPKVRVHLDLTDRRVDLVSEKFDLAIRIGGRRTEESFVQRRLCSLQLVVCAAPEYLERRGSPNNPSELVEHNCLGYRSSADHWSFESGERVAIRGDLSVDNGDALRTAALMGHGIVYLPSFLVAADIHAGRLIPLLQDFPGTVGAAHALYPASRHPARKVRALIDYLAESLGSEPPSSTDTIVRHAATVDAAER